MSNFSKGELVAAVAEKAGLTKPEAANAIEAMIKTIKTQTDAGVIVKIAGLGKFEKKTRAARLGRNPQSGAEIHIPETTVLTFKAGKPKAA